MVALLESRYDALVVSIYRAGGGLIPWAEPLSHVAEVMGVRAVRLVATDKRTGRNLLLHESRVPPPADPSATYSTRIEGNAEADLFLHVYPGAGRAPLNQDETEVLSRIAEHFARAIGIEHSLRIATDRQALAAKLLEDMRQPIILLDATGRIEYRNRAALELLARGDAIVEKQGRLTCRDASSQQELSRALARLASSPALHETTERALIKLGRGNGLPLVAALGGNACHGAGVALTIFEPDAPVEIDSAVLSIAFDLTPAEAAIASLIANGHSPERCSAEMRVKISTVRSQLRSLYGKTGTIGQGDLVRRVLATAGTPPSPSQTRFPARPLRVIVPFPAGSTTDTIVRALSREMEKSLGQRIVVENRPGGDTVLGIAAAAKSAPDGYTVVSVGNSFTVNHALMRTLPYDALRDLRPIGLMAKTPLVLATHPGLRCGDLSELVRHLRAHPDRFTYSSPGIGTMQHVATEAWKAMAGVRIIHVPLAGQTAAIASVVSGEVDLLFGNFLNVLPHVQRGTLRAFAITTLQRFEPAPGIPTLHEQGYAGFESYSWFGLHAPAGVPSGIVERLNGEIKKGLQKNRLRESLIARGIAPLPGSPDEFDGFLRAEILKYERLFRNSHIKV